MHAGGDVSNPDHICQERAHEQFLRNSDGKLKGRYNLAFLVGIEFVGGHQLRRDIETALGNPTIALTNGVPDAT